MHRKSTVRMHNIVLRTGSYSVAGSGALWAVSMFSSSHDLLCDLHEISMSFANKRIKVIKIAKAGVKQKMVKA